MPCMSLFLLFTVKTDTNSIFTLGAALLEVASLWAYRKENPPSQGHEKNSPGGRQPLDAPADSQAPAGTV